jgi:hypothetical protein
VRKPGQAVPPPTQAAARREKQAVYSGSQAEDQEPKVSKDRAVQEQTRV